MSKLKFYSQAPLPFQGQKRYFVAKFKDVLKTIDQPAVIVDLFGGSGLLSHIAKKVLPDCTVVWNDFDNYSERLANVVNTNRILSEIREVLKNSDREKSLSRDDRREVLNIITAETGFIDWSTLSTNLLFSNHYAWSLESIMKESMYNCIRKTDYVVDGYTDGLIVTLQDYRCLYHEYAHIPNVLFLIDPPYLSTNVASYRSGNYWSIVDYLDVLTLLKGSDYIYFTSSKSALIELCDWIGRNGRIIDNPLDGAVRWSVSRAPVYNSSYGDIMLVKT